MLPGVQNTHHSLISLLRRESGETGPAAVEFAARKCLRRSCWKPCWGVCWLYPRNSRIARRRAQTLQAKIEAAVKHLAMVIRRSPTLGKVMGRFGRGDENKGSRVAVRAQTEDGRLLRDHGAGLVKIPTVDLVARHRQAGGVDSSTTSDIERRWWGAGKVPRAACVQPHRVLGSSQGFKEPALLDVANGCVPGSCGADNC